MNPGLLPAWPTLLPLKRVSPSRFCALRRCRLRELWSNCWKPALLPVPAVARLGTVVHSLLENARQGWSPGSTSKEMEARWDTSLRDVEQVMAANWIERPLVPLRDSVPDFEVRRLRALQRASEEFTASPPAAGPRRPGLGSEVWVQSADSTVGGYVDEALIGHHGLTLRDFKTGMIHDPAEPAFLNPDYGIQLKLYAALYQATYGQWPNRLEVVPLSGEAAEVPFAPDECLVLLRQAECALQELNAEIRTVEVAKGSLDQLVSFAAPDPDTCRFCQYRPACPAYRVARVNRHQERWPADVMGELVELRALGNGRLAMLVADDSHDQPVNIRGLDPDPDRHPALLHLASGRYSGVSVSNVRARVGFSSCVEVTATTIYVIATEA